ncbi:DUF2550 domain-containing protein [Cellulomonas aerilata]|uniref:DUF2550 domain-containing protein n=1 Tax=Cellulomonas aerilata TaxID=515326 RepID=A0A512DEC3_9CELL|nr:DUF2550 domain-containing protein [Cellulomonas aerilata]GEO34812.1 hypothetical protein CAE01nite_25370 [Cellulomonas aerilata]
MSGTVVAAALGAVVAVFVVVVLLGASRLRTLSGRVGSFLCSGRRAQPGAPWNAGIAHYGAGRIDWWRSWSLAPRPARSWRREDIEVVSRAPVAGSTDPDLVLVRCRHRGTDYEVTMSRDALAGLTAWLEAAPPTDFSRVI